MPGTCRFVLKWQKGAGMNRILEYLDSGEHRIWGRGRCLAAAAAVTAVYTLLVSMVFPWVYILNDDRFMKEVLSGVYNGTPDAHVIFLKYPMGVVIRNLYQLLPGWDWYGIVMTGISLVCLCLILYRVLRIRETWQGKVFLTGMALICYTAGWLPSLLAFTYTTVAAMAGATALFLYGSSKKTTPVGGAVILLLALTAYLLRDSVFYMLLPFAGILFLNRMAGQRWKGWGRELILPAVLVLLAGLVYLADQAAYSGSQWERILADGDARSVIYNYCGPADYDENKDFYESIGVSRDTYEALVKYNLVVDEDLDTEHLYAIADYSEEAYNASRTVRDRVTQGLATAWQGAMESGCAPLNWVAILMFLWVLVWSAASWHRAGGLAAVKDKSGTGRGAARLFVTAAAVLLVWLAMWFWLGMEGRLPRRVAESLHLCGLLTVAGLYLREGAAFPRGWKKKILTGVIAVPLLLALLISAYKRIGHTSRQTISASENYQIMVDYCYDHPDLFYLADVYSIVGYADVFTLRDDTRELNYLALGDWLAFSPMYEEKLEREGITDLAEDIVTKENIRIICRDYYDMDYLRDYYVRHGYDVEVTVEDTIQQNGEALDVYRFRLAGQEG